MKFLIYIFLGFLLTTDMAQACYVCGGGKDESRLAFLLTTALLTSLPLMIIGGGIWLLARRSGKNSPAITEEA